MKTTSRIDKFERLPFQIHPRVFAALGADLVTNDIVAVLELVKNSYDAFASTVRIRFQNDNKDETYLEIEDDGQGMSKDVIKEAWCMVATPFKEMSPTVSKGRRVRRVSGQKGLGRLSAARLGESLQIITKSPQDKCYEIRVNWTDIAGKDRLSACSALTRTIKDSAPIKDTGTLIRIFHLHRKWDEETISDLEENLARMISPFSETDDFAIHLSRPGMEENPVKIESPEFLSKPKYSFRGAVDRKGNIEGVYRYAPLTRETGRKRKLRASWKQIYDKCKDTTQYPLSSKTAHCGPLSFEIRAWDIGAEDTDQIASRFDLQKRHIRPSIRAHKGISVYRDGILVLPKSDTARDWLGLDLRRVSRVGTRLSTSQIVGYISITANDNPLLIDTSDRERLVSNLQLIEFEELIKSIIALLENERDTDRSEPGREKPLRDLFSQLSGEALLSEITDLAREGADASDAIPVVRTYAASVQALSKAIQERFVYYSRMATVGTIAQMLVHEIRNRTSAFGSFLEFINGRFAPFEDAELALQFGWATEAVDCLERLADTFAPLASRAFRRRSRDAVLEERMVASINLQRAEIGRKKINFSVPNSTTHVAVDPGELDAIFLNVTSNAIYWLGQSDAHIRKLEFEIHPDPSDSRVTVWVNDNGPGIDGEDAERIFWPGITRKPGGIGMGLTVASELVAEYGGRMATKLPGRRGGASFVFDLPLKK